MDDRKEDGHGDPAVSHVLFQPHGGVKGAAEAVSQAFAARTPSLEDITLPGVCAELGGDELAAFFFPVYGGRVPGPCLARAGDPAGDGHPGAAGGGIRQPGGGRCLLEMKNALSARGFRTVAAAEIVAPHSLNTKIGEGRPDGKDREAIAAFAAGVERKLAGGEPEEVEVPGNMPYQDFGGTPLKPTGGRGCTGCGRCSGRLAPPGPFRRTGPGKWIRAGLSGMRCIRVCPAGARSVPLPVRAAVAAALVQKCAGRREIKFYL